MNVGLAFNVITRLADTFEFEVGSRASFEAGARQLLGSGYESGSKSNGAAPPR